MNRECGEVHYCRIYLMLLWRGEEKRAPRSLLATCEGRRSAIGRRQPLVDHVGYSVLIWAEPGDGA
jgi:hypothetical protein